MGVAPLVKTTLIVPRSELQEALRELAAFGWLHPEPLESGVTDPVLADLSIRTLRLQVGFDELVRELGIRGPPGVIEVLLKGYHIPKGRVAAKDWMDFVERIEREASPILADIGKLIEERKALEKTLAETRTLVAALKLISRFSVDIGVLQALRRFHVTFAVVSTRALGEIRRSLPEAFLLDTALTKSDSAFVLAGAKAEQDRIEKTLRTFEVKPLTIPSDLPQNPAKAHRLVEEQAAKLEGQLEDNRAALGEAKRKSEDRIRILRESAQTAYQVLEKLKKNGDLRRLATIQGFVPVTELESLAAKCRPTWLYFTEEIQSFRDHHEESTRPEPPAFFTNRGVAKAFENITLTQGPPRYGELDPTPVITLVFPIFYGMMFGDFGQGLVLLLLGLLIRARGNESMRKWGTLIAAAGASAATIGLVLGEAFGLSLGKLPVIGEKLREVYTPPLEISALEGAHALEVVTSLIAVAILVGVFHLTVAFVLDVVKGYKSKEHVELFAVKLPTLTMYVSGVVFALAFVAVRFDFASLGSDPRPTPLIGLPVNLAVAISLPLILASVVVIMFGKAGAIVMGKLRGESLGMALMMGVIEVLLRVVEFLANSISYARLGILLVVHAALMLAVNRSWSLVGSGSPGMMGLGLFLVVFGNIGVMLLEGLIVFIQDLRLHLYEWFTKFYEGGGRLFQKMLPPTIYVDIEWT